MLQDRNIHRDAQALRKIVSIPLSVPLAGVDQDEPIYSTIPRYNWRLSDLQVYVNAVTTADLIVKAQAVPFVSAVGSPQLTQGSGAATFEVEEFWMHVNTDRLSDRNESPFTPFGATGIATVLDGFWGVWLLESNESLEINVFRQAEIMAFATEELALANCPKVRPGGDFPGGFNGRIAILTIQAVGGDFIAGTTNTDAGLVAAFNTAPQDGHVLTLPISNAAKTVAATLGQKLKDASGTNILQGPGGPGGQDEAAGTMLVISVRSDGSPVLVGPASASVEYRPWPAGGEGLGDTSVSQNRPSFVP